MKRQLFVAFGILLIACASSASAAGKLNFLWLIAEDIGPEMACYGTREVSTPNLDRMAAEGVRYTRAYNGMVCSPSRSAFMTGMYATTIGAHNHRTRDKQPLPEGVRVITDWMRDAGYFTANLVRLPPDLGFKGTGKTDWNFLYDGKPFDSNDWADLKNRQPFFAQINFSQTHRAFHPPQRLANPARVEIPPYYPDHAVTREDWAAYLDEISELDRRIGKVLEQLKKDGLEENTVVIFFGDNGQAMPRGKQFCYESGLHVPMIIRWPSGYPVPSHFEPGSVDHRFVEGIDLAPTMLHLAGAAKPPKMQGRIFLGDGAEAPRKYVVGARDRCDETVMRIRSIRNDRFRYIRNFTPEIPLMAPNAYKERQYPIWNLMKELDAQNKLTAEQKFLTQPRMPDEELYDLQADPYETLNLADSRLPEHRRQLSALRRELEKWIVETRDQGRFAEMQPAN